MAATTQSVAIMSTDDDWELWARRDPYYAVLTDPSYRSKVMSEQTKRQFFETGFGHANFVLETSRLRIDSSFHPVTALDFGCGVGRVTIPLAAKVAHVVGLDVSDSMLSEAARNAETFQCGNIEWVKSVSELQHADRRFDLVHSAITLQHIDIPRGRRLFSDLIDFLNPRGICAIQILYASKRYAESFGTPPANNSNATIPTSSKRPDDVDPPMEMNPYSLSELAFIMQERGIEDFYSKFTDHGGEFGAFVFFRKPANIRGALI